MKDKKKMLSLRGHRQDGRGACLSDGQNLASTHWPACLFLLQRIWAWPPETERQRLGLEEVPVPPVQALGSSDRA